MALEVGGQSEQQAACVPSAFEQFSLLQGPINQIAERSAYRITRGNSLLLGSGLSVALWMILGLLATIDGYSDQFFSLGAMAVHGRMLVAVPLIFLCEKLFDRAVHDACGGLVRSGVVAGDAKSALDRDAARLVGISNSWVIQFALLFAVVLFSVLVPADYLPGVTIVEGTADPGSISSAGLWYWLVCLPAFRFVMARFFWFLGVWSFLLWRLSRQKLNLTASHPDRAGGLGILEVTQSQLLTFVLAIAVINAAALATTFQHVEMDEQKLYLQACLVAIIGAVVITAPLLPLIGQMARRRRAGLLDFTALAQEYSVRFGRRWTEPAQPDYGDLLGAAEIQSLADLSNSYANVRAMRILPVDTSLLAKIFCCAALPHAPLLLMKYPIAELVSNVVQSFLGV